MNRWMALGVMTLVGACGGMEPQEPTDASESAIIEDECWDCECPEPEPEYRCETAFAYGECEPPCDPYVATVYPPEPDPEPECDVSATCFDAYGLSRWGWTNYVTDAPDWIWLKLVAGAGGCDLDRGTEVGWVKVKYENGKLKVKYVVPGDHQLKETHLYVGNDPLAKTKQGRWTVAPGQFPYSGGDYFRVPTSLPDYLIAHAVVCWPVEDEVNGAELCD